MEQAWVQDLVDRAVLVASELVTNAVLHTRGPLRLRLALRGERLQLAVATTRRGCCGSPPTLATPRPKVAAA